MRILFPILVLAGSGCGTMTTLRLAQENAKVEPIYGGVRTDINCIFGVKPEGGKKSTGWDDLTDMVAKPCSIVDLPLSLAADTLLLPYAIVLTLNQRPKPAKDGNDAGASQQPSAAQPAQPLVLEPAQSTSVPSPMEKAK